MAKLAGN